MVKIVMRLISKFTSLLLLIAASSCAQNSGKIFSPHYVQPPTVIKLDNELEEISGISYDASDGNVYAICDDKGSLYKVSLKNGSLLSKLKFNKPKNFEDLVIIDDSCYVLNSNGDLYSFAYKTPGEVKSTTYSFPEGGKNELEILYYNKASGQLMSICKECEKDKKKEVSSFVFDRANSSYTSGSFSLNAKELLQKSSIDKNRFKPSAAAIHPITGQLFILSSINKLLVITDANGNISQTFPLDAKLFKQPEGIAFTPSGDMIISNEAAGKGKATLLIYKFKTIN